MIRTDRAHLNVAAQTHAGMTGKNNEDRYAISSYQLDENDSTPVLFAIVADGIGGHRAGEVAAELAVDHISHVVAESNGHRPKKILEKAILEASDAIASHAASTPEKQGMGATCACIWIIGDKLYTATVGDSRIYLLREGRIQQLTTDHTWIQEAIDKGILTPDLAREHPNVHVIRRYLGSPEPPDVDFRMRLYDSEGDALAEGNQGYQMRPSDILLICTDGLTDLVWNDEIAEIIRAKNSLKSAAQELIETANERGGHDNTTIVLISVPRDLVLRVPPKKRPWVWIIGGILAGLALLSFASVLTINLLRSTILATSTPTLTSTPFPTETVTVTPTRTLVSTPTTLPDPINPLPTLTPNPPTQDVATYTPWPTHTLPPTSTVTPLQ